MPYEIFSPVFNLERDVKRTDWMVEQIRQDQVYAQNLYAALCNTDWQRNEVWPLLKGQTYSCSWRYAGGIVADMIESGDYIDFYCSGIRGGMLSDEERAEMSPEAIERHDWINQHFVGEGHVTDEIREDFFQLGWILVEDKDE
mgnify:CR=1 FL=1